MIGKLIAAVAGQQVAERIGGGSGAKGAALGVVAATVVRRLGPAGIVAALAGGYLLKKAGEKRAASAAPMYGVPPG